MAKTNHTTLLYKWFVRFAFGKKLTRAEIHFTRYLQTEDSILLFGEGAESFLNDIFSKLKEVHIDYIESSEKKLAIAKRNIDPKYLTQINFILGDYNNIPVLIQYDVVITFFVFNMFKQDEALKFARTINSSLKSEGFWLFTDFFSTTSLYHKILFVPIHRFFRFFTGIAVNKIPAYNSIFRHLRFTLVSEISFWNGFIRSRAYSKEFVKPLNLDTLRK